MSSYEIIDELEAGELAVEFEGQEPWEVLEWAIGRFKSKIAVSVALQADDIVLVDMAYQIDPHVQVFTVDTGRLPAESYELIEQLRERYPNLNLDILMPDPEPVQKLVNIHGPNLMYTSIENRLQCCSTRKVVPLQRKLATLDAWVTGLRRDQWATRTNIRKLEVDHDHGGVVKLNPLAEWLEEEVWDYIKQNDLPVHPLYAKGYTSIGCAPCTRAIQPGEEKRAGRWWWESGAPKECGMHCAIETGGFEHQVAAIVGEDTH